MDKHITLEQRIIVIEVCKELGMREAILNI